VDDINYSYCLFPSCFSLLYSSPLTLWIWQLPRQLDLRAYDCKFLVWGLATQSGGIHSSQAPIVHQNHAVVKGRSTKISDNVLLMEVSYCRQNWLSGLELSTIISLLSAYLKSPTVTWLRTVKKFLLRCTASYKAKRTASLVLRKEKDRFGLEYNQYMCLLCTNIIKTQNQTIANDVFRLKGIVLYGWT